MLGKGIYTAMMSYSWMSIQYTLGNYQFTFAALCLRERMKVLNQGLVEHFTTTNQPFKMLRTYILDSMIQMHDQLCDGISKLNSTFAMQLVPFVGYYQVIVISCLHYAILDIFFIKSNNLYLIIANGYWISFYSQTIGFSLHVATTTTTEAKSTANIVHKIINQVKMENDHQFLERV